MKSIFSACAAGLLFSAAVFAQTAEKQETVDEQTADVAITATVKADSLTFETVPNPKVEFSGEPARQTEWSSERRNLPDEVQPTVVYRDIGIKLKIVSVFADIEKIVDEALENADADSKNAAEDDPDEN